MDLYSKIVLHNGTTYEHGSRSNPQDKIVSAIEKISGGYIVIFQDATEKTIGILSIKRAVRT